MVDVGDDREVADEALVVDKAAAQDRDRRAGVFAPLRLMGVTVSVLLVKKPSPPSWIEPLSGCAPPPAGRSKPGGVMPIGLTWPDRGSTRPVGSSPSTSQGYWR